MGYDKQINVNSAKQNLLSATGERKKCALGMTKSQISN